jgi:hypothetical protein
MYEFPWGGSAEWYVSPLTGASKARMAALGGEDGVCRAPEGRAWL